jgi:flagellar basal-body rod modification protein FlgD
MVATEGVASGWNIDSQMFMKILVAQLQNQNPMEPMTNGEMVSQMSDLASLESSRGLTASFGEFMKLCRLTGGVDMIGRTVEYEVGSGIATGLVEEILQDGEELTLKVGSDEISLDDVKRVL